MSGSVVVTATDTVVVVSERERAAVVTPPQPQTAVVVRGVPGPRGLQGVPGPAGGATLVRVGASPISGHSAVAVNADGELIYADCTDAAHLGAVLGVVANAYAAGDDAVVQTAFPLQHSGWAWAPAPVYLGQGGQLTQTLPAGALFVQVVGYALAPTVVLIDLQPPILIS